MYKKWMLPALLFLSSCSQETPKETVRPVKAIRIVESQASENRLRFPGTLRAFKHADLAFRVDGAVMVRDIDVGQKVSKNMVLIRLDPREYKIALAKTKGKVESTQAQLDFTLRDYERMKKIYEADPGAISASLIDRKKENGNQLKAELAIAKSDLVKAADDLSYTILKAPFEGFIAAIYVENHEQVRAKEPVVRLINAADREMDIHVPENYINALLEEGDALESSVSLDAFHGKVFPAAIKEIGPEASSTTQTYPVTLVLKEIPPDLMLLPGMSGTATMNLPKPYGPTAKPVFKVPPSALSTDNLNQTFVWIVDPTALTVSKKTVVVDSKTQGDFAIILEGVAGGEWIVTAGTSFLSEGQKVRSIMELSAP